jgi:putative transposase
MNSLAQRASLLLLIGQACKAGARLNEACAIIGLAARTVQRWVDASKRALHVGDRRTSEQRTHNCPPNKLSQAERQKAMAMLNSHEFKDLPPSQIVPRLADQGLYLASESTLYRLLRQAGQLAHRRPERVPQKRVKPRALVAVQPDQIYCWDITYLPTEVRGMFFYLYLFVDLFSRKVVGWQVFDCESAEKAAALLEDICRRQGVKAHQVTVHSDNGGPMKGQTMHGHHAALGRRAQPQPPGGEQRQPVLRVVVQDPEVQAPVPAQAVCRFAASQALGDRAGALVQREPQA